MIDYLLVYPRTSLRAESNYVPLSICHVGATIEKEGWDVEYFDDRVDSIELFIELVKRSKVVGFSAMVGFQLGRATAMCYLARKINPSVYTVLGGHSAKALQPYHYDGRFPFYDIDKSNHHVNNPITKRNARLFKHFNDPMLMFTRFGCKYNCSFCAIDHNVKEVPFADIFEQLQFFYHECNTKFVSIGDANIGKDKDRIQTIGEMMLDFGFKWHCNMRADVIDADMVEILESNGCRSVEIGVESGVTKINRELFNKGGFEHLFDVRMSAEMFAKTKISPMYSFICNLPLKYSRAIDLETMNEIDKLKSICHHARFSMYPYMPIPNTRLYKKFADKYNIDNIYAWFDIGMDQKPLYWICGLTHRKDNINKNFPAQKRVLIKPFEKWAEFAWKHRIFKFPIKLMEMFAFGRKM